MGAAALELRRKGHLDARARAQFDEFRLENFRWLPRQRSRLDETLPETSFIVVGARLSYDNSRSRAEAKKRYSRE